MLTELVRNQRICKGKEYKGGKLESSRQQKLQFSK